MYYLQFLTLDQMQQHFDRCRAFHEHVNDETSFISRITTGDVIWHRVFQPQTGTFWYHRIKRLVRRTQVKKGQSLNTLPVLLLPLHSVYHFCGSTFCLHSSRVIRLGSKQEIWISYFSFSSITPALVGSA